jgi:hypothetical protein
LRYLGLDGCRNSTDVVVVVAVVGCSTHDRHYPAVALATKCMMGWYAGFPSQVGDEKTQTPVLGRYSQRRLRPIDAYSFLIKMTSARHCNHSRGHFAGQRLGNMGQN